VKAIFNGCSFLADCDASSKIRRIRLRTQRKYARADPVGGRMFERMVAGEDADTGSTAPRR
jgi:hypothetical protein